MSWFTRLWGHIKWGHICFGCPNYNGSNLHNLNVSSLTLQSDLWVFLWVPKRDSHVLTTSSIQRFLPCSSTSALTPGQYILPWMLFEVSLMLRVCLTVDGIPHKVSAVFAKGVFPWFCHFQENQGVLGLMGGSRNDPFPNSTPYPIPPPLLLKGQSSQSQLLLFAVSCVHTCP